MAASSLRRTLPAEEQFNDSLDRNESVGPEDRERQKRRRRDELGPKATLVDDRITVDGLCSACQRIFAEWSFITRIAEKSCLEGPLIAHHESVRAVIRSAKMGCNICGMALFDAPEPWDIDHETDTNGTIKIGEDSPGSPAGQSRKSEVDLIITHWESAFDFEHWDFRFTFRGRYSSSVELHRTQNPGTFLIAILLNWA